MDAPFVGRDGDLRLVKELFHGARERRSARLVAISGEAGVGKSRLRREFFNYIDGLADTVLWHSGRCLSYGEGVAYWALAEMVRQRLGIAEDASAQDASAKLAAGLERWVSDPADREFLSPRLGALLGVAEPGLGREELFSGWRLFFERLATHEPVALVFEDMQWADAGLLDFIEELLGLVGNAARSSSSPWRVPRSRPLARDGRPAGAAPPSWCWSRSTTRPWASSWKRWSTGSPTPPAQRIVAQAQGVPLFAIETVRALADRGVLAERDGRLVLDGELGELEVPASLSSLLAARLDALEPSERGLVKAMSMFGGAFPRSAAAALGDVPEGQLDGVLAALVRKQVLTIRTDPLSPDRGQYAFAQALLRTVAYEMLSRQERKPRHRAAAEHLRSVFPNDGEDVAEVIAAHYLDAYRAAGDDPDAEELRTETMAALSRAAQRAAIVGSPETAERAFLTASELGRDVHERTEMIQQAGEMALQSGRYEVALKLLESALDALPEAGNERDVARIAGRVGRALVYLGRLEDAVDRMSAALATLGPDRLDAEVGALNATLGRALVFAGEYERAGPSLDTALVIAQALKLPAVLCEALTNKAIMYQSIGRAEEARYLYVAAIETGERHDLTAALTRAQHNSGNLAMLWDLPDAAQHLEATLALSRRRGDRGSESFGAGSLMVVHMFAGRWAELERLAGELLDGTEVRPEAESVHCPLTLWHGLRGQTQAAQASLDSVAAWARTGDLEMQAIHASLVISVNLAEGHAEKVIEIGPELLRNAISSLGASNESVRYAWPDTLQAALALDRLDLARSLLALLSEQPPGHIPPYLEAQLVRGRGLVAAAEGQDRAVEADLTAAIGRFRALGYPYWLAVAQTDLAAWLVDHGRGSEATELLDEAVTALASLGAAPALARAQAVLRSPAAAVTAT